jgi:hypothetical protein
LLASIAFIAIVAMLIRPATRKVVGIGLIILLGGSAFNAFALSNKVSRAAMLVLVFVGPVVLLIYLVIGFVYAVFLKPKVSTRLDQKAPKWLDSQ